MQPPNLSALWNAGLDRIEESWVNGKYKYWTRASRESNPRWDVAILNDDAIVPPGWFDAVSWDMRAFDASAGCSDPDGTLRAPVHHRKIGPVGLDRRLVGYAFILRGEHDIRANEDIHWYFSDDHIDYSARELGGTVMIPGFPVEHLHPNGQMSAELSARVAIDARNFKDRWGVMPW
jgi:hypothetical protein